MTAQGAIGLGLLGLGILGLASMGSAAAVQAMPRDAADVAVNVASEVPGLRGVSWDGRAGAYVAHVSGRVRGRRLWSFRPRVLLSTEPVAKPLVLLNGGAVLSCPYQVFLRGGLEQLDNGLSSASGLLQVPAEGGWVLFFRRDPTLALERLARSRGLSFRLRDKQADTVTYIGQSAYGQAPPPMAQAPAAQVLQMAGRAQPGSWTRRNVLQQGARSSWERRVAGTATEADFAVLRAARPGIASGRSGYISPAWTGAPWQPGPSVPPGPGTFDIAAFSERVADQLEAQWEAEGR